MMKPNLVLIVHDVRSTLNVGSLLRTADGLGVEKVYLTGYTPYPTSDHDERLPHIAAKTHRRIAKSSLGAEKTVVWKQSAMLEPILASLKSRGYEIAALEQMPGSIKITDYEAPDKVALILGSEVKGLDKKWLEKSSVILEIPMFGQKESFNVASAAAMALFYLRTANVKM